MEEEEWSTEDALHGSAKTDALTVIEVTERLTLLMETPASLKRLHLYGGRLAYCGLKPEDLLQEALVRLLSGERRWPIGIDVVQVVSGAMQSIASAAYRKSRQIPVLQLVPSHGDGEEIEYDGIETVTPEQVLADKQDLEAVKALFNADEVAAAVLDGVAAGFEGAELCELASIDSAQLATVRKRISRRLQSEFPRGRRS